MIENSFSRPNSGFGAWYEAAVDWCVEAGVVTGYTSGVDEGCFRPDRPVSRQELAVMAWRYAQWAGLDTTDPDPVPLESTTDWESADSWALEALLSLGAFDRKTPQTTW